MRRRRFRAICGPVLVVIAAASAFVAIAAAPGCTARTCLPSSDLAAALDAYDRATINNDAGALAMLVTDDYMLVNSDSSVQGKTSYLADFKAPGFKIEPYRLEHAFTRIHGSAALTGGTFQLRWTQDGRRESRRLRAAHFWVRQDGRWWLAYSQLTRVQA